MDTGEEKKVAKDERGELYLALGDLISKAIEAQNRQAKLLKDFTSI